MVHLDIKPENLILKSADADDSDIRLVDFGSARAAPSFALASAQAAAAVSTVVAAASASGAQKGGGGAEEKQVLSAALDGLVGATASLRDGVTATTVEYSSPEVGIHPTVARVCPS